MHISYTLYNLLRSARLPVNETAAADSEFKTNSTRSGRPPISMIFKLQVVAGVSLEVYLERRVIPEPYNSTYQ